MTIKGSASAKSEKLGGPLSIFHAFFGRYTPFYGHFLVDDVTSEGSTCISSLTHSQTTEVFSKCKVIGVLIWERGKDSQYDSTPKLGFTPIATNFVVLQIKIYASIFEDIFSF